MLLEPNPRTAHRLGAGGQHQRVLPPKLFDSGRQTVKHAKDPEEVLRVLSSFRAGLWK